MWLRGNKADGTMLTSAAVGGLEAIPIVPDAARLRRQLAGRLLEIGQADAAVAELTRALETFRQPGAMPELEKTLGMFQEFGVAPPDDPARSAEKRRLDSIANRHD